MPDGFIIFLVIKDGLSHMDMTKPSTSDMESLPHIVMTCDIEWDPLILDDNPYQHDITNEYAQDITKTMDYDTDLHICAAKW